MEAASLTDFLEIWLKHADENLTSVVLTGCLHCPQVAEIIY